MGAGVEGGGKPIKGFCSHCACIYQSKRGGENYVQYTNTHTPMLLFTQSNIPFIHHLFY